MKAIHERDNYINKAFDFIPSANIVEYDMKSGGFSILKSKELLSAKQIEYLNSLDKKERNRKIGLMQRDDRDMAKELAKGFKEYRKKFFEANNLDETNVVAIKKDAIFVVNTPIKFMQFDKVLFRPKNKYSSYYNINGIEFYYSGRFNTIDVKGIDDDQLHLHKSMISFIKKIIKLNEVSNSSAKRYLYNFADRYRKRKLNAKFYREFKPDGQFRINTGLSTGYFIMDYVENIDDFDLNINFNYANIIRPFISLIF